jgi:hypothetical protein
MGSSSIFVSHVVSLGMMIEVVELNLAKVEKNNLENGRKN